MLEKILGAIMASFVLVFTTYGLVNFLFYDNIRHASWECTAETLTKTSLPKELECIQYTRKDAPFDIDVRGK